MDSAVTLVAFSGGGDSDVTVFTPCSSPRVSDDVVGLLGLFIFTVSDGGDGVVKRGATFSRVDDSSGVVMEHWLISLHGHRNNRLFDGGQQVTLGVFGNLMVDSAPNFARNLIYLAVTSISGARGIRVVLLKFLLVVLKISEPGGLHSTIASLIDSLIVTRNELLLGEAEQFTGVDKMSTLHGSSHREGPAGATVTLVFDRVDGALLSPVKAIVDGFGELFDLFLRDILRVADVAKSLCKLLFCHGREHVVTDGKGIFGVRVDPFEFFVFFNKEVEPKVIFLFCSIRETEFRDVVSES